MSLLFGHMSRMPATAEELLELLPKPTLMFVSEAKMRGEEDQIHLTMSETRTYIFGIPYLRHHLLASIAASVCDRRTYSTQTEFVCTKKHAECAQRQRLGSSPASSAPSHLPCGPSASQGHRRVTGGSSHS